MSQATNPPEHFERCQGYASYDPVGVVDFEKAVSLISSAIRFARDNKIRLLLVDATQLTGFPSPSLAERYFTTRRWAAESETLVELALVLHQYMIDPERFGVQVAVNLGMRADVFDSKSEALNWLLSHDPPQPFAPAKPNL
jgi:hypothetical protein